MRRAENGKRYRQGRAAGGRPSPKTMGPFPILWGAAAESGGKGRSGGRNGSGNRAEEPVSTGRKSGEYVIF